MDAAAKRDMGPGIGSMNIEHAWIIEQRLVMIGRTEGEKYLGAGWDLVSGQFRILDSNPAPACLRRIKPQHLFHGIGDQTGILTDVRPKTRCRQQIYQAVTQ